MSAAADVPLSLEHDLIERGIRVARQRAGRPRGVVGVLLGQDNGKTINVANSFAVPFEEDERDGKTWFLDHDYIEGMMEMFKKVNGTWSALTQRAKR